jgi:hypothetical protein
MRSCPVDSSTDHFSLAPALTRQCKVDAAGASRTAAAQAQTINYTVEWQAFETAQRDQLASTFDGLRNGAATMLSASNQGRTIHLHLNSPSLCTAIGGLRFLQQVVLPAPAAGRTLRIAARQAPAALSGPGVSSSRKPEAAADGLQGLLRVAVAEVHGLSCASVLLHPNSQLPDAAPNWRQQQRVSTAAQAPAYADGHGAACVGGAWLAPRLLPAAGSSAAHGRSSTSGIPLQGGLLLTLQHFLFLLLPLVDDI